jgi:hypothetical protein
MRTYKHVKKGTHRLSNFNTSCLEINHEANIIIEPNPYILGIFGHPFNNVADLKYLAECCPNLLIRPASIKDEYDEPGLIDVVTNCNQRRSTPPELWHHPLIEILLSVNKQHKYYHVIEPVLNKHELLSRGKNFDIYGIYASAGSDGCYEESVFLRLTPIINVLRQ